MDIYDITFRDRVSGKEHVEHITATDLDHAYTQAEDRSEYDIVAITRREREIPDGSEMLVHLNVTVPADDGRSADEIADAILGAIEVGSDNDLVRGLKIVCPLAEEIG